MVDPWGALRFSASGAISILAGTGVRVVEVYVRSQIERARAELRQGSIDAGFDILQETLDGVYTAADTVGSVAADDLLRGVAEAVLAQGLDQVGARDSAREHFAEAVERLQKLPDSMLNGRDHSDLGVALVASGAVDEGLHHILRSRDAGAATPEAARAQAEIYLGRDDAAAAEQLLLEALVAVPSDADALTLLARIHVDRADPQAAATCASAAYALLTRSRYRDTLVVLDQLGSLADAPPGLAGVRAEALRLDGDAENAAAHYDTALEQEPRSPWLLAGAAAARLSLGQLDVAAHTAARGLDAAPEDLDLLIIAGEIALQSDDFDRATELGRQAVGVAPRDAVAHHLLAVAARASGDLDTALAEARSARLLAPRRDLELLRLCGGLEVAVGSPEIAAEIFARIADDRNSVPAEHALYAQLLESLGRSEQAFSVIQSARGRFDDTAPVLGAWGAILRAEDRLEEAVGALEAANALPDHDLDISLALAETHLDLDQLERAIDVLAAAEQEAPASARVRTMRARAYLQGDQWSAAAEAARAALELDAQSVEAMALLGVATHYLGRSADGERLLREALLLEPTDPMTRLYLAQVITDRHPGEAEALVQRLLDEGYETVSAYLTRAQARMRTSDYSGAVDDLTLVHDLEPDYPGIHLELAEACRLAGDSTAALEHAEQAIGRGVETGYAYAVRASALRALGRDDDARRDLHHAVDLEPGYAYARILLAQLTADFEEAQQQLDRAREVAVDQREVDIEQAHLYARTNRPQEALAAYEALMADGQEADVLVGRIDSLRQLGRAKEAVDAGEQAAIMVAEDDSVQRSLALALVEAKQERRAAEILTELEERRGDAASKGDLGWVLSLCDRYDQALDQLMDAIRLDPDDVWTLNQLSRQLGDIGEFAAAARCAERATEIGPDREESWSQLAWVLSYGDEPDFVRGEHAYDTAWRLQRRDDPNPWVLSGRGDCRRGLGDPRADEDFRHALELAQRSQSKGAWMLSGLGWCLYQLGELDAAARKFLEALSQQDVPGSDLFDLALVNFCEGRRKRGPQLYEDAVRQVSKRDPLRQRGLLKVAIADIDRAPAVYGLHDEPVATDIVDLLNRALNDLPRPSKAYPLPNQRT